MSNYPSSTISTNSSAKDFPTLSAASALSSPSKSREVIDFAARLAIINADEYLTQDTASTSASDTITDTLATRRIALWMIDPEDSCRYYTQTTSNMEHMKAGLQNFEDKMMKK